MDEGMESSQLQEMITNGVNGNHDIDIRGEPCGEEEHDPILKVEDNTLKAAVLDGNGNGNVENSSKDQDNNLLESNLKKLCETKAGKESSLQEFNDTIESMEMKKKVEEEEGCCAKTDMIIDNTEYQEDKSKKNIHSACSENSDFPLENDSLESNNCSGVVKKIELSHSDSSFKVDSDKVTQKEVVAEHVEPEVEDIILEKANAGQIQPPFVSMVGHMILPLLDDDSTLDNDIKLNDTKSVIVTENNHSESPVVAELLEGVEDKIMECTSEEPSASQEVAKATITSESDAKSDENDKVIDTKDIPTNVDDKEIANENLEQDSKKDITSEEASASQEDTKTTITSESDAKSDENDKVIDTKANLDEKAIANENLEQDAKKDLLVQESSVKENDSMIVSEPIDSSLHRKSEQEPEPEMEINLVPSGDAEAGAVVENDSEMTVGMSEEAMPEKDDAKANDAKEEASIVGEPLTDSALDQEESKPEMETDLINPTIETVTIEENVGAKPEVIVVEQENPPEMAKDSSTEVYISGSKEITKVEAEIEGEPEGTLGEVPVMIKDSQEDLAKLDLADKHEETAVINETDDSIKKTENIVSATNEALIDPTAELPHTTTDAVSENVSETGDNNIAKEVIKEPEPEKETIPDVVDKTPVIPVPNASIDTNKESTEPAVTIVEDTSTSESVEGKMTEMEMDVTDTKIETDQSKLESDSNPALTIKEEILKEREAVNEAMEPKAACIPNVEASCIPISGIQVEKEEQVDAITKEVEKSETKTDKSKLESDSNPALTTKEEILKESEAVNEATDPEAACISNVEASYVPISSIQVEKEEQVDAVTKEAEKSETKNSNATDAVDEDAIQEPEKETILDIVDETPVADTSIDTNKESTETAVTIANVATVEEENNNKETTTSTEPCVNEKSIEHSVPEPEIENNKGTDDASGEKNRKDSNKETIVAEAEHEKELLDGKVDEKQDTKNGEEKSPNEAVLKTIVPSSQTEKETPKLDVSSDTVKTKVEEEKSSSLSIPPISISEKSSQPLLINTVEKDEKKSKSPKEKPKVEQTKEDKPVTNTSDDNTNTKEEYLTPPPLPVKKAGLKDEKTKENSKPAAATKINLGEPPKPPVRTKGPKAEANESKNSDKAEDNPSTSRQTPISHQDSVRPEQPKGLLGFIKSFFTCMGGKK